VLYYVPLPLYKGSSVNVVFLSKVNIDGEVRLVDFREMLGKEQVLTTLQTYGERVNITTLDPAKEPRLGAGLPLSVVPDSGSPNGTLDITTLYNFCKNKPTFTKEYASQIAAQLTKSSTNTGIDADVVIKFQETYLLLDNYIKGEEKFKVLAPEMTYINPAVTIPAVRDWNSKMGPQFKYIRSDINRTQFMRSPYDTFFMELPSYDRLRSMDVSIAQLVPTGKDLAKPYPHFIYFTPYYKDIFRYNRSQMREQLVSAASLLGINPTKEELEDIPRIDFRLVEGSVDNNDLEVQPNEQDFMHALTELIMFDIKQTFPDHNPEDLFSRCVASPRMVELLSEFVNRVSTLNWMHCGNFPLSYADEDEDDERAASSDGEYGSAEYFPNQSTGIVDGPLLLNKFIMLAAEQGGMGFAAHVEAIIKLSRWGEMKPTVLKLGDFNNYLDMNKFIIRSNTGNISNMKPVLIDGLYEMGIKGVITYDDKFRDLEYRKKLNISNAKINIPIGLACEKYFEGGTRQVVYLSFLDVISRLKENNSDWIKGIEYNNGKLVVNAGSDVLNSKIALRLANESAEASTAKEAVFYESDTVKGLKLEYSVSNLSTLSILFEYLYSDTKLSKWGEMLAFRNKEELQYKMTEVANVPKELYVRTNIATLLAPIVLKASAKFDEREIEFMSEDVQLTESANIYLETMLSNGYVNEGQLWSNVSVEQETKSAAIAEGIASRLAGMNSFAGATETKIEESKAPIVTNTVEKESVVPASDKPIELIEDTTHPSIVHFQETDNKVAFTHNGKVIGCFASREINGVKKYIIGGSSDVPENIRPSQNTLSSLEPLILDWVVKVLEFKEAESQVRFSSVQAAKDLKTMFAQIWNEEKQRRAGGK
jgi:hypothetical protein